MKPTLNVLVLVGALLLMIIQTSYAQSRFNWELRTGVDFATQKLGDADLNTGFGFDGIIGYRFMPHLSAYTGWGWHKFRANNSFAGPDTDFEETGYTLGLQFSDRLGLSKYDYFVRAGGIYNHIEVENSSGDITADSGHGFGWQAEAGLAVSLGKRWQLIPSVRYRSLNRDIEIANTTMETNLAYFNTGVSILRSFR